MHSHYKNQKAMALPITLIALITISMVAVFGMQRTVTELKIVNNTQTSQNLFNIAYSETEAMMNIAKHDMNTFSSYKEQSNRNTIDSDGNSVYPKVAINKIGEYKQKKLTVTNYLKRIGDKGGMVSGSSVSNISVIKLQFITEAKIDNNQNTDKKSNQEIHLEYESLVPQNSLTI